VEDTSIIESAPFFDKLFSGQKRRFVV